MTFRPALRPAVFAAAAAILATLTATFSTAETNGTKSKETEMTTMTKFSTEATLAMNASQGDIWAVWVDVNGWSRWDKGLANTKMTERFVPGSTFELTPQGADPIEVTLKTVTQGEEFSDETVLPFGTLRNTHRMVVKDGKVEVTHGIEAEIAEEAVGFFSAEIWPHMEHGLPAALEGIREIVEN
jgi:hypothetical protein